MSVGEQFCILYWICEDTDCIGGLNKRWNDEVWRHNDKKVNILKENVATSF